MIYKVVVCGDFGVGKSAVILRLCKDTYLQETSSTIGAAYFCTSPPIADSSGCGVVDKFAIWDTAGQERFSNLLPMYFRGAHCVIYCCSSNEIVNMSHLRNTLETIQSCAPTAQIVFAITKCDLPDVVTTMDSLHSFAIPVYCTSAKTGAGITELFANVYKLSKEALLATHSVEKLAIDPCSTTRKNYCANGCV